MKYSYKTIQNSFHSQEPWINVFLLKYITVPLVYIIVNFSKITPNIISFLSISFGLYSAYNYSIGNVFTGGLMYFVSYLFDATDGKVARITKKGKPYGAWLDICIDRINLVLISTAISFNAYQENHSIYILILNTLFIGLAFVGWESRYNIDLFKLKNGLFDKNEKRESKYGKWCRRNGVIKAPISLPELFLFYLMIAPSCNLEFYTLIILIFFMILRIIAQQKFWLNIGQNK